MVVSDKLKIAAKKQLLKDQPLLDVEHTRLQLVQWLTQAQFPLEPGTASWDECVRTFPTAPDDKEAETGRRIRIVFSLQSKQNSYFISILESLVPENRGVYSLIAYVDWQKHEWEMQSFVNREYEGYFDATLSAKHTVWAQNFKNESFVEALNNTAIAILSHELEPRPPNGRIGTPIGRTRRVEPGEIESDDQ
ncbi:MAG: hypothetical protein JSU65_03620 [Candidatus Zixiibacteriota bacterium]|nr:MAG: hypothetical protein JSU65_03620 [candidate division Zixibacteria bacterium]